MTPRQDVRVGAVYDGRTPRDGTRILVDRVWPRGLTKNAAELDEWCKDIAPSTALRRWYGHQPARFDEFAHRYQVELEASPQVEAAEHLRELAQHETLTLLTATGQPEISHAVVLADLLNHAEHREPDYLRAVVPRADLPPMGEVVVGVDGSPGSLDALRWALDKAAARGHNLTAVTAWEYPVETTFAAMATAGDFHPVIAAEETLLKALADTEPSSADESVTTAAIEGHPTEVLLRAATQAQLLVVGSRGRGKLLGALLGSVSQYVAAHAACPVVVIKPENNHPGGRPYLHCRP